MLDKFFTTVLNRQWAVALSTLVVTIVCSIGLAGLATSNDYRSFLDDDYPGILKLAEIESLFSENKIGLILISPKEGEIFTAQGLHVVRQFTEDAWAISWVKRVDSLANFQFTQANGDDLTVNDLVPLGETISPELVALARQVSMTDPSIQKLLVAGDGSMAAISITFEISGSDTPDQAIRNDVAQQFFSLVDQYRADYPEYDFHESGTFFADYYSDQYLQEINQILMPIMILIMMVLLATLLRSLSGLLAATTVVVGSGLITMGIVGWSGMLLEAVAAMGPIVIMTLAVADSVHIIVGAQAAHGAGMSKHDAIKESLRLNFMPVFLTSLTTALGVITFVFTDFPSLRKLGVIIALGVTVAFILSVTILPTIMKWLPLKAREHGAGGHKMYALLADIAISHFRIVLPLALLISAVLAFGMTRAVVDESFENMFKPGTEIAESIELADEKMAGILQLDVAVFSGNDQDVSTPEFLQTLESFQTWALTRNNVSHVQSITDTIKRLNRSMNGDDDAFYQLPASQELAAQYLLLYELSLPIGLDLSHQVSLDKKATRMTVSGQNASSMTVLEIQQDIRTWFAENAPQYEVSVVGLVALMSEVSAYELVPKMARGGVIAIVMVSLVLFFALRSWQLGMLGMLANVVPIAVGYGLWAWSGSLYNFIVISVAGICLGMVVDFAVHFLDKFRYSYKRSGDAEQAIHYATDKVASPIVITALVLMCGFFVLSFTKTETFDGLGLLTPLIIMLSVLFDLLVLPALLMVVYGRKYGHKHGHKRALPLQ